MSFFGCPFSFRTPTYEEREVNTKLSWLFKVDFEGHPAPVFVRRVTARQTLRNALMLVLALQVQQGTSDVW